MADPHIKSPMDVWDYATVILYRSGFCLAAPMLFILPWYSETAQIGLLIAATLCASCVQLQGIFLFPCICIEFATDFFRTIVV